MVKNSYDVIVVGLGAMGSAAVYHLARRGARVLGIEQFGIPHGRGSSHGYSRMIRQAYHEHADYVPLLVRAYALWRELEAEFGHRILYETGGLYIGQTKSERLARTTAAAEEHHITYERLGHADLADRYPMFHLPEDYEAVFEARAGFLKPELAVAAHAIGALKRGAVLQAQETVFEWSADENGVAVRTDRDVYRAEQILFCGGAWSQQLLGELGVPLVVTRQVLGWVWPKSPDLFAPGQFPVWSIAKEDGTSHYGFPMMPDNPGFKTAHHAPGIPIDPDQLTSEVTPTDEAEIRWPIDKFIPDADGPLLALRTCLYTNSPDGHFIIDRHPNQERVLLACGFSGHGFKFSSVVGETLAELALDGTSSLPARFLGLSRLYQSVAERA